MNVDLSLNPEAQTVNPAEARRIAQMQAEIVRLQPTRKPSTTSFGGTSDSSMSTPTRTADVEERRKTIARLMAPTPEDETSRRWREYEERNAARSAAYEKEQADIQAQLRQNDEARRAEANRQLELKRKQAAFREADNLIDMTIEQRGLTRSEAGVVHQRLLDVGRIHDTDLCSLLCQEIVISRDSTPVRDDVAPLDWRGALRKK